MPVPGLARYPSPVTPTVLRLTRFPVKSMLGEDLDEVEVQERGMTGDRLWAVTYPDGKLGSGKNSTRFRRTDGLLHFAARAGDGGARPHVTVPGGDPLRDDAHLAELLGVPVKLSREADVDHFDDGPISLATTASLRALGGLLGDAEPVDVRRFRKNIVLDTAEPWIEEQWVGRVLAIGEHLRLRVAMALPRCVMTTMAQGEDLPADNRILKTVTRERDQCFGIVAEVVTPGTIRVGDELRVV